MEAAASDGLQKYGNDPVLKYFVAFAKVLQSNLFALLYPFVLFICLNLFSYDICKLKMTLLNGISDFFFFLLFLASTLKIFNYCISSWLLELKCLAVLSEGEWPELVTCGLIEGKSGWGRHSINLKKSREYKIKVFIISHQMQRM